MKTKKNDGTEDAKAAVEALPVHKHKAAKVGVTGKANTFEIECSCGETEIAGTWWDVVPKGWDKQSWIMTRAAGVMLLGVWDNFGHESIQIQE